MDNIINAFQELYSLAVREWCSHPIFGNLFPKFTLGYSYIVLLIDMIVETG